MKPYRIDIPGCISAQAILEHRVCILDTDSGAGKTLFLTSLVNYCSLKKLSFARVNFKNCIDFDCALARCKRSALVILDDADLYDYGTIVRSLTSKTKLILIAGHNLSLDDISCPDVGYYTVIKEQNMLRVKRNP